MIKLHPQEQVGTYHFDDVPIYITVGLANKLGRSCQKIVAESLDILITKYGDNADYLQVFTYQNELRKVIKYWAIHDADYVTFLLPSEY